ncbi:MAG: flagellar biosynthesis protein FlhB [Eubacteriales bacterium]|nr:flagellar biosynthesis protein FlhB [Eubacteriales bacterium]MDD3199265.1 flagellar biosynthesis protein FlhB [Eubacteriales bacterium]MDD4629395.1 flagellar biosynthesis protein FlhB [Eubacteriales bacterium]
MAESNKTEKATPKKKRDERKKGNAFQSRDIVSVGMLIVGFILISRLGSFITKQIRELYIHELSYVSTTYDLTIAGCMQILRESIIVFFISAVPIMIALALTGIVLTGAQTRFLVSGDLLKFKYSRISIVQGFKRMFSLKSLVQLIKSIIKVAVILWVIYTSLKDLMVVAPDMFNSGFDESIAFMMDRVMAIVYKICMIFIVIAVLDFAFQKFDYEQKLKMTKQEVKDEYKQTEGDPFIKGKIKEKQRKMSMNRMIQQVPQADVIVRNPTHFAVALKYDLENDQAPVVLAKGQDYMAMRIIDIGLKHNILMTENKPLARSLFQTVEVNDYIPAELYKAVAEVMAWVYSTKKKGGKAI